MILITKTTLLMAKYLRLTPFIKLRLLNKSRVSTKQSILLRNSCVVLCEMTFFARNSASFLYQYETSFAQNCTFLQNKRFYCTKFCMDMKFKSEFFPDNCMNTVHFRIYFRNAHEYKKLKFLYSSVHENEIK